MNALGFVLRKIQTGEYRYFYAHENNTLFDKSMLLCTKSDLTSTQNKVNKQDIIEVCTQERQNTKWRFKLITNVTIFAALLKNVPTGCPDSVIPKPLLRNHQVDCLISDHDEGYHDKGIEMLKLGCTLTNLVNICLHKSTDYKFYPFYPNDSDLLEKYGKI